MQGVLLRQPTDVRQRSKRGYVKLVDNWARDTLCDVCVCVRVCGSVACFISEDEAQEALLGNVSERCCYGKAAATEMDIYQIISSCALHVRTSYVTVITRLSLTGLSTPSAPPM